MVILCVWMLLVNHRGGMNEPSDSKTGSVSPKGHLDSLFMPGTMFFPSQQHYNPSCVAIVYGPRLCAGESYVMHRLAKVFSSLLTCSNNINFNKYLWRPAVIGWYG